MTEIGEKRKKGGLLKTGQTTQYAGYADDGYYQKGLLKQYLILTTGQHAGTTDITLNAKTDTHSNNCIYDQRTKLMWSRYVPGSVGPGSDGKLPWTTNENGEGIFPYAAAANAAKLAGYSDWRVPNLLELQSLYHMQTDTVVPDPTAFPTFPVDDSFWSSTTRKAVPTQALWQEYNTGQASISAKTTNFHLILVRGG